MSTVKAKKERVEYKQQSRTKCFSISASHKLPVSHNFNIIFQCAFPNSAVSLLPSLSHTCPSENLQHQSGSSQKRAHWHWTSLLQRISFPSDFYDSSKQQKWKINNRQTFLRNTSSPGKNKKPISHKSGKLNATAIFQPQIPASSKLHFSWKKALWSPLLFSKMCVLLYKVTGWRAEVSLIFCDIHMKSLSLEEHETTPASAGAQGNRWCLLCFGNHYHSQRFSTTHHSLDDTNNHLPWSPTLVLISQISGAGP